MKSINQLNLNSGESQKFRRNEIDPSLIFTLSALYKDSLDSKGVVANIQGDQYHIHTTLTSNGGLTTICAFVGASTFPLLSTSYSDLSLDVYYELYDTCKKNDSLNHTRTKTPQIPYCCDVETTLGSMIVGPINWRDDFCRCMAWCGLDELKRRRN